MTWTLEDAIKRTDQRVWAGTRGQAKNLENCGEAVSFFGKTKLLSEIKTPDIDDYVAHLEAKGNRPSTINRKVACLSRVFTFAVQRQAIDKKPLLELKKLGKGRVRFLTNEEEAKMFRILADWQLPDIHDLYAFLIDTGARAGEALRVEIKDFTETTVSFWETKADNPRTIPMTSRVKAIFERRRGLLGSGKLFPFSYECARLHWLRLRKAMGLEHDRQFVIHAFRHTCASRLAQKGFPLLKIMRWLGHKKIETTMIYAHLAPGDLDAGAALLESTSVA